MKKLTILFSLILSVLFVACSVEDDLNDLANQGDEELCKGEIADFEAELQKITELAQTYALDQSLTNCQAYLAGLQTYLDEAEELINCYTLDTNKEEVRQAINSYKQELENTTCE